MITNTITKTTKELNNKPTTNLKQEIKKAKQLADLLYEKKEKLRMKKKRAYDDYFEIEKPYYRGTQKLEKAHNKWKRATNTYKKARTQYDQQETVIKQLSLLLKIRNNSL